MIYGYIRVSTDRQDTEAQKIGVLSKAKELGLMVESWISDDGVSGVKEPEKRLLGKLLKKVGEGDVIISSEISRLGRNLFMIMRILEHCMKVGAKVYTVKDCYELGDNIQSKVLAFAFGLAAEIERDMISKRTKEALAHRRAEGAVLGRKIGCKSKNLKLDKRETEIKRYLDKNISFSGIARIMNCHRLTVSKICEERGWLSDERVEKRKRCQAIVKKRKKIQLFYCPVSDEDLIELYKKHFSITKIADILSVHSNALTNYIKRKGIYEQLQKINEEQRLKVKSKGQIERESLEQ
ncbi:Transposon gamma-delta resolvase [termite gut metagenome]|uniref:Transposon gamma-delta resolvase n=1 Tax=termite gut metagenome TaxID=433724 RepID=A0A5J4SM04_9ZZZZ